MPRIVNQSPSPKNHIKTLMRIGYTLNSAISDLVDNSIAAGASNIDIFAPPGLDEPYISIIDDGCGMKPAELIENMRIACRDPDSPREKGDLGRFGSGMKTASFSQARQLTVISKYVDSPAIAAQWDIDRIEQTDSWCLAVLEGQEIEAIAGLTLDLDKGAGTQLILGGLTCLDRGSHSMAADEELASRLSSLEKHLALYFHRFMSGTGKINFSVNGRRVMPLNPFMTDEAGYQEGLGERMRCKGGFIEIKTHVLPHFKRMPKKLVERHGGAETITKGQGLYIYRERRLISAGGWMGMARSSQLGALARLQVDIPSSLDNDWATDVKKASLQIPPKVRRELRKFLTEPVKRSRRVHRYRGQKEEANGFWKVCENENEKTITYEIDTTNAQLIDVLSACPHSARPKIIEYLKKLSLAMPIHHIYEKMSERPEDVSQKDVNFSELDSLLDKLLENSK